MIKGVQKGGVCNLVEKKRVKRTRAVEIGIKLKSIRTARGLTQKAIAEKVGISESSWRMMELGERIPSDNVKSKIARYLKTKEGKLFFD